MSESFNWSYFFGASVGVIAEHWSPSEDWSEVGFTVFVIFVIMLAAQKK